MQTYRKYTWVGNRISEEDMTRLYRLKEIRKRPITLLVADAIRQFLEKEDIGMVAAHTQDVNRGEHI